VKSNDLSFSKDVADTIGVEAAIILKFIEDNKITTNSLEDISEIILEKFSFMEEKEIVSSIEKIAGLGLIKIKSDKYHKVKLKLPHRSGSNKSNIMNSDWEPSSEAIEVLELGGIDIDFASLKLKEFRIYWKEKKVYKDNWNSVFINYIRKEWVQFNSKNKGMPYTMADDWMPSSSALDILELSEIKKDTALSYLSEFILFWKDNGAALKTWNVKFVDFVKRKEIGSYNTKNEPGKFTKTFKERKSDQSWAEEIE
jgi:hypothetical protein